MKVTEQFVSIDQNVPNDTQFLAEIMEEYFNEAIRSGFTRDEAYDYAILMVQPSTRSATS